MYFRFSSLIGYYKILSVVPCAIQLQQYACLTTPAGAPSANLSHNCQKLKPRADALTSLLKAL